MINNATNAKELISDLAKELKSVVENTEKSFATTKNHYADYMAIINQLSKGNKKMAQVIALALIQAGGNKQGILSAMQFI